MASYERRFSHRLARGVRSSETQELIDDLQALIRAGYVTPAEGPDGQLRIAVVDDDQPPPDDADGGWRRRAGPPFSAR